MLQKTNISSSHTSSPLRAYLALAGGIACIGFAPILIKLTDASSDVIGFYRMAITTLVMCLPLVFRYRRGMAYFSRPAILLSIIAAFFFTVDLGIWNTALTLTSAANATLLGNTAPVWVGLGAWLIFREKLRPSYWVGLVVALAGAAIIVGGDGFSGASEAMWGNLMSLFAGVAYAGYQLVTQRARQQIDTFSYMGLLAAVSALFFFILTLLLGHSLRVSAASLRTLVGLALISQVGGWSLINYAFGHLRASLVSVTLLGQPIVAMLLAIPILRETPAPLHLFGGAITLVGIILVHRSTEK